MLPDRLAIKGFAQEARKAREDNSHSMIYFEYEHTHAVIYPISIKYKGGSQKNTDNPLVQQADEFASRFCWTISAVGASVGTMPKGSPSIDGASVGVADGNDVGDGEPEGRSVGELEGETVGTEEGRPDGVNVGIKDDTEDGPFESSDDGSVDDDGAWVLEDVLDPREGCAVGLVDVAGNPLCDGSLDGVFE